MTVYIVIGEKENVHQDTIGGEFLPHPDKEIVAVFFDDKNARNFVADNRLSKGKRQPYGDTSYYRNGYYDLQIERWDVE